MTDWKTLLAAALLAIVPAAAFAQDCGSKGRDVTMTCAPGSSFDAETGTCITDVTG